MATMALHGPQLARHRLRNLLHSVLLVTGLILLCATLGWFIWGGQGFLVIGAIGLLFVLFGPQVSPRLVLRMYRARPLSDANAPRLLAVARELARRAGLPRVPQLYYIPSAIVNAFAVGTRRDAAIGLTDGILRSLSQRELTGVLAHEVSHVSHNDGWVMSLADFVSRIVNTFSWVGQLLLFINLPLLMTGRATVPWLLILLLIVAPTLSALLQLALSRSREYDADVGAARLTGDPRGLAAGLAKLERLQGGFFERIMLPGRRVPEPSLLRTHPNTQERIDRLLELEGETASPRLTPEAPLRRELAQLMVPPPRTPRWHVSGLWY
jgi:heat shock protein HtpX